MRTWSGVVGAANDISEWTTFRSKTISGETRVWGLTIPGLFHISVPQTVYNGTMVNTFVPYFTFMESLAALDSQRLGKQRVEAAQILDALDGKTRGWANHPAARMWRGYEEALQLYHDCCIRRWVYRGYANNMPFRWKGTVDDHVWLPPWWDVGAVQHSHRCNLMRKDPDWYCQFVWKGVDPRTPYHWPDNEEYIACGYKPRKAHALSQDSLLNYPSLRLDHEYEKRKQDRATAFASRRHKT